MFGRPFLPVFLIVMSSMLVLSSAPAPQVTAVSPAPDIRYLPAGIEEKDEIISQRTATSATFQQPDGSLTTIFSFSALHYQDEQGQWQPVDLAFRSAPEGFVVTHNSIQSQAGLRRPWLGAKVGETAVIWEATALGTRIGSAFTPLSQPLAEGKLPDLQQNGRVLHYTEGWDDPALVEQIISAPDSVEHTLVLAEPPPAIEADFLEMQATLDLLPGAALWANGAAQISAFSTSGRLEIRDADGQTAFVFEPVVAYEAGNRATAVSGEYNVEPEGENGRWSVRVRTPYSWWLEAARRYPVVLDPTIRVLTPSMPGKNGLAWIGRDGSFQYNQLRLGGHLSQYNSDAYGYMQFNALPAILTSNAVSITHASLSVTPRIYPEGMPLYSNSKPDWDSVSIQRKTKLTYVGACPGASGCPPVFNLAAASLPPTFNYANSPLGQPLVSGDAPPLKVGPATKGGKGTTAVWDVTSELKEWYKDHWSASDTAPTFRLAFENGCPQPGPYFFGFDSQGKVVNKTPLVPHCTWFDIPDVILEVTHSTHPLFVNDDSILNWPGVPSYLSGVFPEEGEFDTDHVYGLAPNPDPNNPGTHWRAVAVRGNHALDPESNLPATVNLQILEEASLAGTTFVKPDTTQIIYINDHAPGGTAGTSLTARVLGSDQNNFEDDIGRNYRLEYVAAFPVTFNGTTAAFGVSFPSDSLISLHEFNAPEGANIRITADLPDALEVQLVNPTASGKTSAVNPQVDSFDAAGTLGPLSAPATGTYALALINKARPVVCTNPIDDDCIEDEAKIYHDPFIEITVCPSGTIPVDKFKVNGVSCQPIYLPQGADAANFAQRTVNGITVYKRPAAGGFDDNPTVPGADWCTTTASDISTPVIGPSQNGRWLIVAQGDVCYDAEMDVLFTTDDSGVALAVVQDKAGTLEIEGNIPAGLVYGATTLPVGLQDGRVHIDNSQAQPVDDATPTLRKLTPFAGTGPSTTSGLWEEEYSSHTDYISLTDMKARGEGLLTSDISAESTFSVAWDVDWNVYPVQDQFKAVPPPGYLKFGYDFEVNISNQTNAFPLPLPLSSINLYILDGGGTPSGLLEEIQAAYTNTGPKAEQLRASVARIAVDEILGSASKQVEVVIRPPGYGLLPEGKTSCSGACLDLRPADYEYENGVGEWSSSYKPWELPDITVTGQTGTVSMATAGKLHLYSVDHPFASQGANNISQSFSFDTWDVIANLSQGPCTPDGPVKTIIEGKGKVALPMVGDDGSGPGPYIDVAFTLCETALREAELTLNIAPTALPVASSGLGVDLIGGKVTVGPDSTRIVMDVGLRTMDNFTLTKQDSPQNGTVTIDTDGLFSLQANSRIVQKLDADFKLEVAWNPLDVLLEGNVSYGGGLISGYLRLHGWIGQGWQGKYSYLPDNSDFHFTGTIKAAVSIKKGHLIDEKFFKLPWFNASISAEVSFGEFCSNKSTCLPVRWGLSATIKVFGYGVGVYVDKGGPEIFLGSSNKVLVDQCTSCSSNNVSGIREETAVSHPSDPATPTSPQIFNTTLVPPGAAQPYMTQTFKSPFANTTPVSSNSLCTGFGTAVHTCTFTVEPGSGRAFFGVGWLNGKLDAALITPGGLVITPANAAANNVVITPFKEEDGLREGVNFAVNPATTGGAISPGSWKVRLSGISLDPTLVNHYALALALDPPLPTIDWQSVLEPQTPPVGGTLPLQWQASRNGQPLENDVTLELFYAPVYQPPPWQPLTASFPGSYMAAAGYGSNWDPADADIAATDPNQDDVWTLTTSAIPSGDWAYKVARNGAWDENYGRNGVYYGENISFTVTSSQPVRFYYDPRDNFSTTNTETKIVSLVGDMMSEIGGADWAAGNLVGWLKPSHEQDDLYETILYIPTGDWHYKVALNESNADIYGADGQLNGPSLNLSVPDGDALVRFVYDDTTHLISHELLAATPGTMITRPSDPNTGAPLPNTTQYNWSIGGLAAGEYRVGARLDDHFHGGGQIISWAPGTVLITADTIAPPVPQILFSYPQQDALIVFWQRDDVTPDLAGYLIEYQIPNPLPHEPNIERTRRMLPLLKYKSPFSQHTRLGGLWLSDPNLPPVETNVCVRAYDLHGNISGCQPFSTTMPEEAADRPLIGPPRFLSATGAPLSIGWEPPEYGVAAGYLVSYTPTGCLAGEEFASAAEGASPLDVGDTLNYDLHGLVLDQVYLITVQAYTAEGVLSEAAVTNGRYLNMIDQDGNGLPDAWAELYGIEDPMGDLDRDGLNNRREAIVGGNPFHADSDEDGFYDGAEVAWETDVCGTSQPPYHAQPKMTLNGLVNLSFETAVNMPTAPPQLITIFNMGEGTLTWTAVPSASWIHLSQTTGFELADIDISVDATGLAPGEYEGSVTIRSPQTAVMLPTGNIAPAVNEIYVIPIRLTVLPEVVPEPSLLYLPLIKTSP